MERGIKADRVRIICSVKGYGKEFKEYYPIIQNELKEKLTAQHLAMIIELMAGVQGKKEN